jgi:phage tail sheath protein FI
MPEYLAPGVYVEETSYRSKSIEGVSTTTTGFIGPTRYGPVNEDPEILTSLGEFERTYGDGGRLAFGDTRMDNFVWHAARAFYTEGGKRLYVSRTFFPLATAIGSLAVDGHGAKAVGGVTFRARYPGASPFDRDATCSARCSAAMAWPRRRSARSVRAISCGSATP